MFLLLTNGLGGSDERDSQGLADTGELLHPPREGEGEGVTRCIMHAESF